MFYVYVCVSVCVYIYTCIYIYIYTDSHAPKKENIPMIQRIHATFKKFDVIVGHKSLIHLKELESCRV